MGGGPVERSRLYDDFKCRCQACDETMEIDQADDPRVIIDRCGCIFRKTHLEAFLRSQLSTNVLTWFTRGVEVSRFSCPNRDYIVGEKFTVLDVIEDPTDRYKEIWRKSLESLDCGNFATLTGKENLNTRQFALIPEALGEVLKTIYEEQMSTGWEGMNWSTFNRELRSLRERFQRGEDLGSDFDTLRRYERLARETLIDWEQRKNGALPDRRLAFDQTGWNPIKKMFFTCRFIYHCAVAVIFEYGLWLLRQGNFVSPLTQQEYREANVGDRLAILLLEWNGIGYNLQDRPLNTVEYRLWRHVTTH